MGLLPVVLSVSLPCVVTAPLAMKVVSPCQGSMVCRSLVISGLVVFSRFSVVFGGLGKMF